MLNILITALLILYIHVKRHILFGFYSKQKAPVVAGAFCYLKFGRLVLIKLDICFDVFGCVDNLQIISTCCHITDYNL